jgi:glycosyltransferase involved in cell wall biosynthesis
MRIAYDISFIAFNYLKSNRKTGLYRVIEEVLLALSARNDVDITAVSVCHENPVLLQILAQGYLKQHNHLPNVRYAETVRSRIGSVSWYRNRYSAHVEKIVNSYPPRTFGSYAFWGALKGIQELQRLVLYQKLDSRNNIDIFHSPFLKLPSRAVIGNIPRVMTVYDLIPIVASENTGWLFNRYFKRIVNSIDRDRDFIICISEHTKRDFCEYTGMSPARVFVTPLAADDSFRPVTDEARLKQCRKKYGIPDGNYFLTLAELQPRKNLARLIQAFVRFLSASSQKDTYLVLVGSYGWQYGEIFKTTEHFSDHRDKIIFTGYVPDDDLAAIYSGAQLFVYPSLYEGFGLPPLEAMQCGVPVIASNRTSIPEVVGDAGLLLDPLNIDDWSQAMISLSSDKSLRKNMREKGLERAKQYSWGKCAEDTVNIYKSILGK